MKGKLLSCLLAAVLMLTIIPQTAFAEDTAEKQSDYEGRFCVINDVAANRC